MPIRRLAQLRETSEQTKCSIQYRYTHAPPICQHIQLQLLTASLSLSLSIHLSPAPYSLRCERLYIFMYLRYIHNVRYRFKEKNSRAGARNRYVHFLKVFRRYKNTVQIIVKLTETEKLGIIIS